MADQNGALSAQPTVDIQPSAPNPSPGRDNINARANVLSKEGALPHVKDMEGYKAVQEGMPFFDATTGVVRYKPYTVTDADSYRQVPEGRVYRTPSGERRTKQKYGDIEGGAQVLYNMSGNDDERRNALAKYYGPQNVKQDPAGDFYVVGPNGKNLKPSHGSIFGDAAASAIGEAAPVVGGVVGAFGGPWTSAGGAVAGQAFNDLVLGLTGIYKRSPVDEATGLAAQGALSGGGEIAGRALAKSAPAAVQAIRDIREGGWSGLGDRLAGKPRAAIANLLGANADPEATATARSLAEKGVRVSPSTWAKETPYLHRVTDVFDPAFRTQKVLEQSAGEHYDKEATRIARELGIPVGGKMTTPTVPANPEKTGAIIMQKAASTVQKYNTELDAAAHNARVALTKDATAKESQRAAAIAQLTEAAKNNQKAAQDAIDVGFKHITDDMATMVKKANLGDKPGDLWRGTSDKITALRKAVGAQASAGYKAADAAAGDVKPNVEPLVEQAKSFLASLPKEFQDRYPGLISDLKALKNGETTFGQLHNIRSQMRSDVDWYSVTNSLREGGLKHFSGAIDKVINDSEAHPSLKAAAALLRKTDDFYAKNMPFFHDAAVRNIVAGMESGMPPDAGKLASVVMQPEFAERIAGIRKAVGPEVWGAVQAADAKRIFDASKNIIGETDAGAFSREVLSRVQNGSMAAAYDKAFADKIALQAKRLALVKGDLPVEKMAGDTVATYLQRATVAQNEIERKVKEDPLGMLAKGIKETDQRLAVAKRSLAQSPTAYGTKDPLGFLSRSTTGTLDAANRIVESPDLMTTAAQRFGTNSPEWKSLREYALLRMFQRSARSSGKMEAELTGKEGISDHVQDLLFGSQKKDVQQLAKEMAFLMHDHGGGAGSSIAAMERVMNPWGSITGLGHYARPIEWIPGMEMLGRSILTKYYAAVTWGVTHPGFVKWVTDGISSKEAGKRAAAWAAIDKIGQIGGAVGAGTAVGVSSWPQNPEAPPQQGNQQ